MELLRPPILPPALVSPFLLRAIRFAEQAHRGGVRKYTGEPYITHPLSVAQMLADNGYYDNGPVLAAAILHDVLEDTPTTPGQIIDIFPAELVDVAQYTLQLVLELTDVSKPSDGNRAKRKYLDLLHTANASQIGKTIKLADLIDNSESITTYDPDFAVVYMAEKKQLLQVLKEGNRKLWCKVNAIVEQYYAQKS